MKVLVLAAGRSKRIKPVVDKNFLEFLGKPLIKWQLESLKENGFEDVVVVGGAHNLERLGVVCREVFPDVTVVEQKDLDMGMCGAVLAGREVVKDESVLIFSSNDVVDGKAFRLVRDTAESDDADACILGKKVDEYFPGGYLEVSDGFISGIVEKPGHGNEPSDMVNLVVHCFSNYAKLVEYLDGAKSDHDDVYEIALDKMMKDGLKFKAVEYDGFWQPIKYPWHVRPVFKYLFDKAEKRVSESAKIADSAVVKGDVIIEDDVKVFDGAVINGPVYLGRGSIVANNALVRDSHVGRDCVIGYSTEIARSFLGNDVWTHTNYIGDSVIGNNVSFGAGTVTGNLRLDEKNVCVDCDGNKIDCGSNKFGLVTGDNVRVGVNTSFMPGIKVGGDSFIGAGIVIAQNIPKKSFVRGDWNLKISENKASADMSGRDEIKNNLKNG